MTDEDGRVVRGRQTRARIVAAARELFGERGYDGTSIDAVLATAGIKKGALYHHFATKEALFDAVLDALTADVAAHAARAARAAGEDPVENLRAGCHAWLESVLDPAIQRISLVDAPAVVGWTRWRELDERYTLGGLRASLARVAAAGGVPAEHVELLGNMLLAAVSEAALMIARADDPPAALASGKAAVDLLLDRMTMPR